MFGYNPCSKPHIGLARSDVIICRISVRRFRSRFFFRAEPKQFTAYYAAFLFPERRGELLHERIICCFCSFVRRIGARGDEAGEYCHSAHCATYLPHPSHSSSEPGCQGKEFLPPDGKQVLKSEYYCLTAVVPLKEQVFSTLLPVSYRDIAYFHCTFYGWLSSSFLPSVLFS